MIYSPGFEKRGKDRGVSAAARIHNARLKAAAAMRFRRFSTKLLQVRLAESAARRRALDPRGAPPRLPRSVIIRVTERCFLRCRMCGQNGDRGRLRDVPPGRRPVFDARALDRALEEIGHWPLKPFLKLTGGEPLVEREMTVGALERAASLGLVTKLNTNGVLLADDRVARRVAASGLDFLSVSIDGPADVHDAIRGRRGTYKAVLEGIANIRGHARGARRRPMILVSAVVSRLNQNRLLDLARGLGGAGIDWLNFEFMNFTTPDLSLAAKDLMHARLGGDGEPWAAFANTGLAYDVDTEALAGEIAAVRRERLSFPVSFLGIGDLSARNLAAYYHRVEDPLREDLCAMPYSAAFLVPPARMVFCIDYPFHFYADLEETTLAEGWRGRAAGEFRRALEERHGRERANLPQCRRCNWRFN